MTTTHVTETKPQDTEALQRVVLETGLFPPELLPDLLEQCWNGTETAIWQTVHQGSEPVGFCYVVPEPMTEGTWNMRALAVRPDCQGEGLGAALVAATETVLRLSRVRLLLVDTSGTDTFAATRSFYLTQGYAQEARIRDFWAAGDDKVTFRKVL